MTRAGPRPTRGRRARKTVAVVAATSAASRTSTARSGSTSPGRSRKSGTCTNSHSGWKPLVPCIPSNVKPAPRATLRAIWK